MREADHLIGVKRAQPDARGNWTPLPAYEGWVPREQRPLTAHGLGFTLIITVLAAWICTHLGA